MRCGYCSIKIGKSHIYKRPYNLFTRILCKDCYDYLKDIPSTKRSYLYKKADNK